MIDYDEYRFAEKWSEEIAEYNFTQVPNLLIACQGHLKLKDKDLLTLIHLQMHWFNEEGTISPSITRLAKFSSSGYSTVQKRLTALEKKGFIKRRHRFGSSNTYSLSPCITKLWKHLYECTDLPYKRGDNADKLSGVPPSGITKKEYQTLKRLNTKNTSASSNKSDDIYSSKALEALGVVWKI